MLRQVGRLTLVMMVAAGLSACSSMKAKSGRTTPTAAPDTSTPVPTVPPKGAEPTPVPLPKQGDSAAPARQDQPKLGETSVPRTTGSGLRPIRNPETDQLKAAGKVVGPVITFAGIARADGHQVAPTSIKDGIPTYTNSVGSGFVVVVEAKPGLSGVEVGRRTMTYNPEDPKARPDLEIQATRPLGDGSEAICDQRRPKIGGMPAIDPPSFAEKLKIAHALNDWSCRFETFIEAQSACVVDKQGDFAFINSDTTTQFCMVVARAWNFPEGTTLVSVRLRDTEGNPGPIKQFRLYRPTAAEMPTPVKKPIPVVTPQSRRRP